MLVRFEYIAIVARTEIGSFGVGAVLRAQSGWIAFVKVLARVSVAAELFAGRTYAQRTHRRFLASIRTQPRLMLTFGQIAAGPFISSIRAIQCAVAHRCHIHATCRNARTQPLTDWTSERWWYACMQRALVTVVATIIFAIADIRLEYTVRIVAFVEIRWTRNRSAFLFV